MSPEKYFSETYREARAKFIDAASKCGARLTHYRHPALGRDGEELYFDVALVGEPDASRVFVVGSGTHGIEGFTGSAVQTAWLLENAGRHRPADTAVALFHALNPWGFSHRTRVTEDNVDLNRNFVDFRAALPANPWYEELHASLTPVVWNEDVKVETFRFLDQFRSRVGEQAFSDAFNGGQYAHPEGMAFGGRGPQWSAVTFLQAVQAHLGHAERVAMIDLHTGVGPYLDHVFLCFHPPESPAYSRARDWWGERAVNRAGVTHKAVASYKGLLVDAFCAALPAAQTTTVVVEFGTRSRVDMQQALIEGRWLRFEGANQPEMARRIQADYDEAFTPADPDWRSAVLRQACQLIDKGIAGISSA